jgi:hypothetical protein
LIKDRRIALGRTAHVVIPSCFDKLDGLAKSSFFDVVDRNEDFVRNLAVPSVVSGLKSASSSDLKDSVVHFASRCYVCDYELVLDVFDSFYVGWTGVCGCDANEFDLDVLDCLVALLIVNAEFKTNFLANIVLSAREVYFSYIMSIFLNLS